MKLKYYLRGLGVGMLVAALVLILSGNTGGKMSDEAVKRRAAQLGMVEKDKTVLEDIGGGTDAEEDAEAVQPEISGEEPVSGEAEENGGKQAGEAAPEEDAERQEEEKKPETDTERQAEEPEENVTGQAGEAETNTNAEEQTLAQEIEQRADEVADRAQEVAENSVTEKTITLEIRRGDSSVSVARKAADAGLVESAADFDVFLCQNGYDKRISIGSYEITLGASEKEIADAITKSK